MSTKQVASCIIQKGNRYLLIQERQPHVYGLWNLPGGHVDEGETLEAAAIREAKEETGFEVKVEKRVASMQVQGDPRLHAFTTRIIGGELKIPTDEILAAKWFTYEEIKELDIQKLVRDSWALRAIDQLK